jgi:predicted aspartyl protease
MIDITALYLGVIQPPGPFASVTVTDPASGQSVPDQAAQLDTAADRTVLPERIVNQLGLVPVRHIALVGFGGVPALFPVFPVTLVLPTLTPISVEVTAQADEPWILLGRDVLNRYKVLLDGPNSRLTITEGP